MAYNPTTGEWETEDASVSGRLTGLLSKQSPLIKQARTQGLQAANSRGLLNSSMAVGAAQNSAYAAALPIASQEASQTHQANLSKQEFGQQRALMADDLSGRERLQSRDIEQQRYLQQQDIGMRERISTLDREAQDRIANMNLAASERGAASNLAASFEGSYASIVANIMNNENLPADVRRQYLDHAAKTRDSNLALVEQMYGIDLNWTTAPSTTAGGGTTDTPPVPSNGNGTDAWYWPFNK